MGGVCGELRVGGGGWGGRRGGSAVNSRTFSDEVDGLNDDKNTFPLFGSGGTPKAQVVETVLSCRMSRL